MIKTRLEQPQAGMKSLGMAFWDIIFWHLKKFGAIWVTLIRGNVGHPFSSKLDKVNFWHPYTTLYVSNNPIEQPIDPYAWKQSFPQKMLIFRILLYRIGHHKINHLSKCLNCQQNRYGLFQIPILTRPGCLGVHQSLF